MFELVVLHECEPKRIAQFLTINRERFQPYSPTRSDNYFTASHWRAACRRSKTEWRDGTAYRFCILHRNEEVIGKIDIDPVTRGAFESGSIGYLLDRRHEGQSVMRRALEEVLGMAFNEFGLNRIQAAIMPENTRSQALVNRLGFRKIGLAERYLKLDGDWRDHMLNEFVAKPAPAPAPEKAKPEKKAAPADRKKASTEQS